MFRARDEEDLEFDLEHAPPSSSIEPIPKKPRGPKKSGYFSDEDASD